MPATTNGVNSRLEILEKHPGVFDMATFGQVLEMDDDEEDREFSRSIVDGFFGQAEQTFGQMEEAMANGDLKTLSELGHFLKGSSATLGLVKVKDSCEKIQHFGAHKDITGTRDIPDVGLCLKNIRETFEALERDYASAKNLLNDFYVTKE